MPKKKYDELAENPSGVRRIVCEQIGFFAIRFVTLVAALAASVSVNPATANVLYSFGTVPKSGKFNPSYRTPVLTKSGGQRGGEVSPSVLNSLRNPGGERNDVFKPVRVGEDHDERELYYFDPMDSVVIDTKRDMVYNSKREKTAVLKIFIEPYTGPVRNTRRNNVRMQGDRMGNRMGPMNRFRNNRYDDDRRFRGGKVKTRRSNRLYGGAGDVLFKVSLYQIIGCSSVCSSDPVLLFLMNQKGITYNLDEYRGGTGIPISKPFVERVQQALDKQTAFVPTESPTMVPKDSGTPIFSPIWKIEELTLKRFKDIRAAIAGGSAPSNDRAFLLSSTLGISPNGTKQTLKTMICDDKLQGQKLTSSVAYSLLQSLYDDLPTGDSDVNSAAECSAVVQKFLSEGLVDLGTPGSSIPTKLSDLKFKVQTKGLASSLCSTQTSGPRSVEIEDLKQVFMNAYTILRDMYDDHVQQVIRLLQKMVNFGEEGSSTLTLEKIFLEHSAGAQVALNSLIHEARNLLAEHYLRVEGVYQSVLLNLGKVQAGQMPATNQTNRLNKSANKLKKELY